MASIDLGLTTVTPELRAQAIVLQGLDYRVLLTVKDGQVYATAIGKDVAPAEAMKDVKDVGDLAATSIAIGVVP